MSKILELVNRVFGNRPCAKFLFGEPADVSFLSGHFQLVQKLVEQTGQHSTVSLGRKKKKSDLGIQTLKPEESGLAVGHSPVLIITYKDVLDRDYTAERIISALDHEHEVEYKYEIFYPSTALASIIFDNFMAVLRTHPRGRREVAVPKELSPESPEFYVNGYSGERLVMAFLGSAIPPISVRA